jgi:hypothetical protein
MAMAYRDASHPDLQSLASEFPKLLEFYIAWSLLKQPDLDDVSRLAKTTVSEQSTGSTHPDRLAAFFEARNVHWRLGEDPLKIPEWVIVRSLLVLGYQKSTEASQNTASTPNAATSRTRALQVCISLNHSKGTGCQQIADGHPHGGEAAPETALVVRCVLDQENHRAAVLGTGTQTLQHTQ